MIKQATVAKDQLAREREDFLFLLRYGSVGREREVASFSAFEDVYGLQALCSPIHQQIHSHLLIVHELHGKPRGIALTPFIDLLSVSPG